MINNTRLEQFISVMNDLIESEQKPLRSDVWMIPQLHEKRHKLWAEMTEVEREIARIKLGKNASKI